MKDMKRTGRKNPLLKRVPRELRRDLGKYIALFLFMAMMIGMVSGFIIADSSMVHTYNESFTKYRIENGHFICSRKLTESEVKNIEKEDVKLYRQFYKDKPARWKKEQKTIRVYPVKTKVNLADVMKGRLPERKGEIAIDRLFAKNNGIETGDRLRVEGRDLEVTGFVALVEYSALFKNNYDMMFNATAFSVAVVNRSQFREFDDSGLSYCYAWRYDDQDLTDDEQQDRAEDLKETVFKNSMQGFRPGLKDYVPRHENQAIRFAGDDMGRDKVMFVWFLYIVTIVLAFAFAITVRSTIEQEAKVIGTLRASGYTRRELLAHYVTLPVAVTLVSALAGNILGYTGLKYAMADMYYNSYSLPTYETVWSTEAFVKTTVIPCLIVAAVVLIVISRSLSLPPLQFLRRDLKRRKQSRPVKLPGFRFKTRFYLRVMLQNKSTYVLLFIGIFLASVIFLFGSLFMPLLDNFRTQIQDSEFCNYQYVLKAQTETDTRGAEKYAVKTLENDNGEKITVYGIQKDSRYLDADKVKEMNTGKVLFSNGYYEKYDTEKGETIRLKEEFASDRYSFKADGEYEYPASLAVFMNIDKFRDTFETDDDYYSGYFSDSRLKDIPESDIASVITEEDLLTTSNQLEDSMGGAFTLFLIIAILMFVLMVFLLAKLVTERNAYAISMLKILGYTNREAGSLYQTATGIAVVISLILSGVFGISLIKVIYHTMMQTFTGWMTFYAAPWGVPVLIATGLVCYGLVSLLLMRKIRKIPMTDALKDADSL
ncbi:MAG: ABC transporter permease [Firmicutes bacterium]|nr:ABC transporter permease [Bacillota bacterium]